MSSKSPWGGRKNNVWLLGGSVEQQLLQLPGRGQGTAQKPQGARSEAAPQDLALRWLCKLRKHQQVCRGCGSSIQKSGMY